MHGGCAFPSCPLWAAPDSYTPGDPVDEIYGVEQGIHLGMRNANTPTHAQAEDGHRYCFLHFFFFTACREGFSQRLSTWVGCHDG